MPFVSQASRAARPSVTGTLRALEEMLFDGGQRTARRNAWAAVQADRERAAARCEAERALRAAVERARTPAPELPSSHG